MLTVIWVTAAGVNAVLTHGDTNNWIGGAVYLLLVLTSVTGIPAACVVAVLKYRLYDIDRLISRTLAYAIVTGLLVGFYAGLVLLATRVLPLHTPVAAAGSTLAAAALFSPLRRRVQKEWTAGSTGLGTTRNRWSSRLPPGCRMPPTWTRCGST